MDSPNDLGQIQPGFFADSLVVNGDPFVDPKVLLDRKKLLVVMKSGEFHQRLRAAVACPRWPEDPALASICQSSGARLGEPE